MKKHLIAAAVAAAVVAPAAMAQQVTVYGIIDAGYMSTKTVSAANPAVTAKTSTMGADGALSGSRLGFRGTEDLGGGLKANFQLEMGLANPTDDGMIANASNRFSFVGLSGGFGEVRIGRFPTLNKLINDSTVFGGASFTTAGASNSGWGWTAQANGAGVSNERINNAFHYISPSFSGVNLQLQLVDDVNDASTDTAAKTRVEGAFIGINYAAGPLALRYANKNVKSETAAGAAPAATGTSFNGTLRLDPVFGLVNNITQAGSLAVAAVEETKVKQDSVLASYDFGVARVVYTYNNTKTSPLTAANELKRTDNTLGVAVPLGTITLLGQYGTGTQKAVGTADDKLKGLQLGAVYTLSKRTNVYAVYGDGENKDGATGRKATDEVWALGLRHSF